MNRKISFGKAWAGLGRWYTVESSATHLGGWFKGLHRRGGLTNRHNSKVALFITIEEYMIFMSAKAEKLEKGETEACSLSLCKQEVGPN